MLGFEFNLGNGIAFVVSILSRPWLCAHSIMKINEKGHKQSPRKSVYFGVKDITTLYVLYNIKLDQGHLGMSDPLKLDF